MVTSALASIAISHLILFCARVVALSEKAPFSMAIGNEKLMQECLAKYMRMVTRMKKETEEGWRSRDHRKKVKRGRKKKEVPTA